MAAPILIWARLWSAYTVQCMACRRLICFPIWIPSHCSVQRMYQFQKCLQFKYQREGSTAEPRERPTCAYCSPGPGTFLSMCFPFGAIAKIIASCGIAKWKPHDCNSEIVRRVQHLWYSGGKKKEEGLKFKNENRETMRVCGWRQTSLDRINPKPAATASPRTALPAERKFICCVSKVLQSDRPELHGNSNRLLLKALNLKL